VHQHILTSVSVTELYPPGRGASLEQVAVRARSGKRENEYAAIDPVD